MCVQSKVQWTIRIPSEPRSRSERNELPRRSARPHGAFVDVPFFSVPFFSFPPLAPSSSPRIQQQKRPSSSRHKMTHSYQSQSLLPSPLLCLHISLLFNLLVSRSRTTLTDTRPLSRASRTLLHISRFSVSFFLCTYIYSIQSSLPPPRLPLLYNIELADKQRACI